MVCKELELKELEVKLILILIYTLTDKDYFEKIEAAVERLNELKEE
jgi:hypothetical protein